MREYRLLIGGTTDGGTTDGGTTDGGGVRTANSMFAAASNLPSLFAVARPGWDKVIANKFAAWAGGFFPVDGWDPLMKAGVIAGRFAGNGTWEKACDPGFPPDDPRHYVDYVANPEAVPTPPEIDKADKALKDEMGFLIDMSVMRTTDDIVKEIRDQEGGFTAQFFRLAGCSAEVRRETFCLVFVGVQLGALVCSHYKMKYMRQRPAQVWPGINPVIATPRHPAYPSGHALQAFLVARLLTKVSPSLKDPAFALANRIAKNREVAGVHYRSDTAKSVEISKNILAELKNFKDKDYVALISGAQAEFSGAQATVATPGTPLRDLGVPVAIGEDEPTYV